MPSGEWTDGAFPIRRARIVAARLDTYRPSSPTADMACHRTTAIVVIDITED
jgi:hypothetical protein